MRRGRSDSDRPLREVRGSGVEVRRCRRRCRRRSARRCRRRSARRCRRRAAAPRCRRRSAAPPASAWVSQLRGTVRGDARRRARQRRLRVIAEARPDVRVARPSGRLSEGTFSTTRPGAGSGARHRAYKSPTRQGRGPRRCQGWWTSVSETVCDTVSETVCDTVSGRGGQAVSTRRSRLTPHRRECRATVPATAKPAAAFRIQSAA